MIDKNSTKEEVLKEWWGVQYAIEKIRGDREVVLKAVKQDSWALQWALNQLKKKEVKI